MTTNPATYESLSSAPRDEEALADEIAHDCVSPPDDDAGEFDTRRVFARLYVARAAALVSLLAGNDCDTAGEAARAALGMV
jgi:hypothetical protein